MFTAQLDESGWTDQLRSSGRSAYLYFLRISIVLNSLLELADEMNPLSIHDMLTDLNMNAHSTCLISLYEKLLLS